jgi:MerR family redox-sensitive transcriptional activator SoxR
MPLLPDEISIGTLAARSGVSTSALRFYEDLGLISANRNAGNQRRYPRFILRRVAFIRAAQRVGLSLDDIAQALAGMPLDNAPAKADWARLSRAWRPRLDVRIREMEKLRDELADCIGCGCLSLRTCRLINTDDVAATDGPGSYLLEDRGSRRQSARVAEAVNRRDPSSVTAAGG